MARQKNQTSLMNFLDNFKSLYPEIQLLP